MRPLFAFMVAVTAMGRVDPGAPIFPSMSEGANDSMWVRYHPVLVADLSK